MQKSRVQLDHTGAQGGRKLDQEGQVGGVGRGAYRTAESAGGRGQGRQGGPKGASSLLPKLYIYLTGTSGWQLLMKLL